MTPNNGTARYVPSTNRGSAIRIRLLDNASDKSKICHVVAKRPEEGATARGFNCGRLRKGLRGEDKQPRRRAGCSGGASKYYREEDVGGMAIDL